MTYINNKIKKVYFEDKGYGFVAVENINKGELLIKEKPAVVINNDTLYSELFQLLYEIIKDIKIFDKFKKLVPKTLKEYNINKDEIYKELDKLKKIDKPLYNFFNEIDENELLLYCAKYMCNAFEFNNRPTILFTGTLLNHSCMPNVIFSEKDGYMCFISVINIKKGEELFDNYINIKMAKNERLKLLSKQYGFKCKCSRCNCDDIRIKDKFNKLELNIEKQSIKYFGKSVLEE